MSEKLNDQEKQFEFRAEQITDDQEKQEKAPIKHESSEVVKARLEEAREDIESSEAKGAESLERALSEGSDSKQAPIMPPGDQEKNVTLNTNLSIIRSRLNKRQKSFSNFVHKPVIDSLSEVTAKTVIRPSAILMGGLFTLVGSSVYLYLNKQTGFKYNFFVAIILFLGGFIVGLILELMYRVLFFKTNK